MNSVNSLLSSLITQQNQSLNQSVSKDQLAKLDDILSKFDAKNFTQADFQNLGQQLQQAGIPPSKQVQSAIQAKAIDVTQYVNNAQQPESSNISKGGTYGPAYKLDVSDLAKQIISNSDSGNGVKLTDEQKTTIQNIFDKYKDAPKTKETFDKIHDELKAANVLPQQLGQKPPADPSNAGGSGQDSDKPNDRKGPPADGRPAGGPPAGGGGGGVTVDNSGAVDKAKREVIPQVGVTGANKVVDKDGNINRRELKQLIQQQQTNTHTDSTE